MASHRASPQVLLLDGSWMVHVVFLSQVLSFLFILSELQIYLLRANLGIQGMNQG